MTDRTQGIPAPSMTADAVSLPDIVDADAWAIARDALLAEEKALTRARDALAARRRRLPMTPVDGAYRFVGPEGETDLVGLFQGRRQLIVYHHMLRPADPAPCEGCSFFGDQIPDLAHLHARDTTLAFVAAAPIAEIEAYRRRMGWTFPFWESRDGFTADMGVRGFGLNVFVRDGGTVYRTWSTGGRGVEMLGSAWAFLDLTPLGRQEAWEDSPDGRPRGAPYAWWRIHDSYGPVAEPDPPRAGLDAP